MNIPIILNPDIILNRGNDLQEFFWPILYFVKQAILTLHQIPLWNNLFLAGTPLASDPQSPIFYPPNVFALFLPLDSFFIISFVFHIVLGGIGMYFLSKNGFKFSKKTSLFLAVLYVAAPKLAAYLEAGHVGLTNSMAWIPWVFLAVLYIRTKPKIKHSILYALSLALLYYSHLPTFLIIALSSALFLINKRSIVYLAAGVALTFGLTAISLLPQLRWQSQSTRYLLIKDKDVYPKWNSVFEPIKIATVPWVLGVKNLQKLESEKWIALGIIPSFLSLLGFIKLKKKYKFLILAGVFAVFLLILNNASPIYPLLLKQNWYLLLRVSTRFWILIILLSLYLIGLAIEKSKTKLIYFIALLGILESFVLGVIYLEKPANENPNMATKEVYDYLSKDKSLFRVYCTTRCLSQKQSAIFGLELLDGYSTVQQNNFFKHSWQMTGAYWNYYTLSIPPIGAYTYEKPQPDAKSLGEYNTKYIISLYKLTDKNLILKEKIDNFLIYQNSLFVPRDYEIYTPNHIRINIKTLKSQIVLPEVYSPGWKAYLNGNEEVVVQETPNALRAVDISPDTKWVDLRYHPNGFEKGKYITLTTLLAIIAYGYYKISQKNKKG